MTRRVRRAKQGPGNASPDGKSQTSTFTNYNAGLPQNISYHDGTSESAVVTTNGYIMSMTNAAGFTTSFGYDAMGRPNSITYPTADTVAWNGTTILSEKVATSEFGITGAHWRETASTGNARSITYYDGLLRPVLNRTFDSASPLTTGTAVRKTFDHMGNVTFESYPLRDIADVNTAANGVTRSFDALGRPSTEVAASELGNLTTISSYGNPFTTTVTNPRGKSSTYSYYAWDTPTTDFVRAIAMPDSVNLTINRNTYGATTNMVRAKGAQSVTRSYVYDSFERLCKTIEPEVGATVQDYDLANNVAWKATGQNLASTSSCDTASVPASAIIAMGYDGRNRLATTIYGDGSPSITRTYTADGLPYTVTSNGSVWTNSYNKRRLIERESMNLNGTVYNIDRTYDANGSLNTLKYPDAATTLTYAPNALGKATTVGTYASAITYYPNGAIASFNYGNGIAHSLTQNVRGLPRQSSDAGVMNDLYDYDANGNVAKITDQQESLTTRTMGYDDLDRITSVSAPSLWGTATYGYDGLDNLISSTITTGTTARTNSHSIDPSSNRLTNVSSSNGAFAFGYGYDSRGNITLRGSQVYVFDIGNRISSATGKATYSYDGFGRRTIVAQTNGTNRSQVYGQDGKLYYASQTGGPQAASTTKYIYIDSHLLAEVDSVGGTQYAHTDALGSPVARTSTVTTVLNRTRFEPYGYVATGASGTIGFSGHVNDADTGLTYMQQRYYDSVAGRFLSIDPVTTDANAGSSFNRYAYANNSPYRFTDPDGRQAALAWCFGGPVGCAAGALLTGATIYYADKALTDTTVLMQHRSGNSSNSAASPSTSTAGANPPPDDDKNNQRKDVSRDNNRKTEGKEQPASDKVGKQMGKQIEKDLGKDARQDFHNMKEKGAPDRTATQLRQDAADIYKEAGKEAPKWTQ
jgi:RHS repeat-associated protein